MSSSVVLHLTCVCVRVYVCECVYDRVCMCLCCVFMSIQVHVPMGTHVEMKGDIRCPHQAPGTVTKLEANSFSQAGYPVAWDPSFSTPTEDWSCRRVQPCPTFFRGARDLNSRPHACVAVISQAEPSCLPSSYLGAETKAIASDSWTGSRLLLSLSETVPVLH